MTHYDLIVCGAGPAGTVAAATAAQRGLKVALLEKYSLPRHKPCGGGTPVAIHQVLQDLVPDAVVECNVRYMRHTWQFGDPYLGAMNLPDSDDHYSLWMVQRTLFDRALALRAVQAGVELRDGLAVRSLELESSRVTVRAKAMKANGDSGQGGEFVATACQVIGADGANGIVAKVAKLRQNPAIALGMEIELPHAWDANHPILKPDTIHVEYGAIPRGYAWIFPKANHLNIGAGVFHSRYRDARQDPKARGEIQRTIFEYMDHLQIPYQREALKFYAHPLPIWNGPEPLHTTDGRLLLAGDAAGLINPVFGDGILHAVRSGVIAGNCVAEGKVHQYSDRIHAEFATNFDAARQLAFMFYRFPKLCSKYGVKHPKGTRLVTRLLSGDLEFTGILGRSIRRIGMGLVQDLFRPSTENSVL